MTDQKNFNPKQIHCRDLGLPVRYIVQCPKHSVKCSWCHIVEYSAVAYSEAGSHSQGFRYPIPLKIGRDWIYIITIHLLQKNPIHNFPGWLSLPFWKERKRIQFRRSEHAKQCSEIQSLKMHSLYQKIIITDGFAQLHMESHF